MTTDVQKSAGRVRDLVNAVRRIHTLLADKSRWNKVCAAMDVVGDTELAIVEYDRLRTQQSSKGLCYLIVYGILQILFVQQDATRHIAEAIGLHFKLPKELLHIRELRNAFTGHPTEHRRAGNIFQSFISRPTLSVTGFQYRRTSIRGKDKWGFVNIPDLITRQRAQISKLLEKSVKQLQKAELKHRRKFRATKLASAFPDTLGYGFEKMGEGIRNPSMRTSIGKWGLENTTKAVEDFKKLLNKRGVLEAYNMSVVPLLKELQYPFKQMIKYYSNQPTHIRDEDAEIFLFYTEAKVNELKELAIEIDKEYESDAI